MILLDTCTLLWLSSDPSQLTHEAQQLIVKNAENLFVSAISAFEIGIKSRKGKLDLPLALGDWFEKTLQYHGISEIPVNSEIAIRSTGLPALHHDPCDRIIIATAQINDMTIITPDPLIKQYDGLKVAW